MSSKSLLYQSNLLNLLVDLEHGFCKPNEPLEKNYFSVHQVHSADILSADDASQETLKSTKADGLISSQNKTLAIQTADCIPILVATKNLEFIGAIHAGWKGVLSGIVPEIFNYLTKVGQNREDMMFSFGPSIQKCCLEVSDELINEFQTKWGSTWEKFQKPFSKNNQPRHKFTPVSHNNWLDLQKVAQYQLFSLGIRSRQIDSIGLCTYCHQTDSEFTFASYRRATHLKSEPTQTSKRQWSWIRLNRTKVD